jgi:pseudaminic acid biosynthesis-associated methylase
MWRGPFGNDYVDRNDYAEWQIEQGAAVFRRILGDVKVESVLEVGSNIGRNLLSIDRLFDGEAQLYAVEPNEKAYKKLVAQTDFQLAGAWNCDAFKLPVPDSSVDLAFTAGVLIHIAPGDLARATDEVVRAAGKYVLCIEYFSHDPVSIPYRGHGNMLFKRDFGSFYLDRYPSLTTINYGFLWKREFPNFDNSNWWLFRKS